MPGRPKKARIKATCETSGSQISRVGITMTCKNCWQKGHNKASYKADSQPKLIVEKKQLGRKKHIVVGQCASRGGGTCRGDGNDDSSSRMGSIGDGSNSGIRGSGSGGKGGETSSRGGGRGRRGGGIAGRGGGRGSRGSRSRRGGGMAGSRSMSVLTAEEELDLQIAHVGKTSSIKRSTKPLKGKDHVQRSVPGSAGSVDEWNRQPKSMEPAYSTKSEFYFAKS
ncbi:hypothetical protein Tco_0906386 [Tanacetum coccineum]|uniref:Uncharacterized protein n=1 Tax=Tanacetum coccineum TaxID=301880 RepID=A0ABQ5CGB5_9ASTR